MEKKLTTIITIFQQFYTTTHDAQHIPRVRTSLKAEMVGQAMEVVLDTAHQNQTWPSHHTRQ